MTRTILVAVFTAATISAQTASAWEALDNFVEDIGNFLTIDQGPPVDYGPPPAVYTPPPEPAPVPPIVVPMAGAPAPYLPPPAAPSCCPSCGSNWCPSCDTLCRQPRDCCAALKECWQKCCDRWRALWAGCCSTAVPAPVYQPPYVTGPAGPPSAMIVDEQPYSVGYPPADSYETYSDGPALIFGPTVQDGPATGTTSEIIPAPIGST